MKRFALLSPARTGSTLLRTTLATHREICCHGEVFGRQRIIGYFPCKNEGPKLDADAENLRQADTNAFLDRYVFFTPQGVRAVGFKLLYYQVGEIQFAEAMERLAYDDAIVLIHLWRRNLVRRCMSYEVHNRSVRGTTGPFTLDEEFVAQDCRNQIALRNRMRVIFSEKAMLNVEYEDLIERRQVVLDEVCRFLGASTGEVKLPKKSDRSNRWNPLTASTKHLNWAGKTEMNIRRVLYILQQFASKHRLNKKGIDGAFLANAEALLGSPRLKPYLDVPLMAS